VLARIPIEIRDLHHKNREDVVLYLQTWRAMLTEALPVTTGPACSRV